MNQILKVAEPYEILIGAKYESSLMLKHLSSVVEMEHAKLILGEDKYTSLTEIIKSLQHNDPLITRILKTVNNVG
jgi:hypothetical protein